MHTRTHAHTTSAIVSVAGAGRGVEKGKRRNVNRVKMLILLQSFINKPHLAPARHAMSVPNIVTRLLSGDLVGETEVCTAGWGELPVS